MENQYGSLVSIVIPVYKAEEYIGKCIESLQNQTYSNLQIILIEDSSPDNSGQICDDYAAKDDRLLLFIMSVIWVLVRRVMMDLLS